MNQSFLLPHFVLGHQDSLLKELAVRIGDSTVALSFAFQSLGLTSPESAVSAAMKLSWVQLSTQLFLTSSNCVCCVFAGSNLTYVGASGFSCASNACTFCVCEQMK